MELREATQEDWEYMNAHSVSRGIQKKIPERVEYVYTLEHDGVPLMVGGFRLLNASTSWCWFDLSDKAGEHIYTVYRTIKEWGDKFVEDHNLTRLQTYVKVDFPEAIRVVEHCGFVKEFEKPMKNFVDNTDAYMYVRFKEA